MLNSFAVALTVLFLAGCASNPAVPDAARAQLAPTGKLRAGMNLGNTLFTTKDAATGELRGVSVDLMRELASRLDVPVEFVVHATPGDVADAAQKGTWDVAILAIEQSRAQTIAFSPPISEIEATYAVHKDSPLRSIEQVDAPGIRISAPEKGRLRALPCANAAQRYAGSRREHAGVDRPVQRPGCRRSRRAEADAPCGHEQDAGCAAARGQVHGVNHGLGVPRERGAAAEFLKLFVQEMNASGFIARSIERHGVQGLSPVK
jgi:polar amino acid transport system substrate-binding protein